MAAMARAAPDSGHWLLGAAAIVVDAERPLLPAVLSPDAVTAATAVLEAAAAFMVVAAAVGLAAACAPLCSNTPCCGACRELVPIISLGPAAAEGWTLCAPVGLPTAVAAALPLVPMAVATLALVPWAEEAALAVGPAAPVAAASSCKWSSATTLRFDGGCPAARPEEVVPPLALGRFNGVGDFVASRIVIMSGALQNNGAQGEDADAAAGAVASALMAVASGAPGAVAGALMAVAAAGVDAR